jgi:hypothetical protein
MSKKLCGIALIALVVGACAEGTVNPPPDNNVEISGTITVDGIPLGGSFVQLGLDDGDPGWYTTVALFQIETTDTGAYAFRGFIDPAFCNRLWLIIDALGYRQQFPECGEHVIDVDASINTRISGTVTLDGSIFAGADLFLAVDQLDPGGLLLRRLEVDFSDTLGEYSFESRVAPDLCDKLYVWWQSHGVSHAEQVPGCGTSTVDVAATS